MSSRTGLLAALLAAAAAVPAAAQTAIVPGTPVPVPGAVVSTADASDDPILASCLLIGARAQSQVCGFARQRVQSEELKGFAKAEVEQQEALTAKCNKLGYEYPSAAASAPVVAGSPSLAVGRVVLSSGASRCVAIDRQVAEQCVDSFKMDAGKKSDAEFDRAFAHTQLAGHHVWRDKLTVFRERAGGELRSVVASELESCEADIRQLEQYVVKFDQPAGDQSQSGAGSPDARRPGRRRADNNPSQTTEGLMAACLLVDARKQREVCEAARSQARAEAVRQFVTAEIEQATEFVSACEKVGYEYPAEVADGGCRVGRVTLPPAAAAAVALDRRVAEQCVETFKANRDKKSGAEFDKAFVGMQLVGYYACKDRLDVYKDSAPAQLRPLVVGQLAVCEADIQTLESIMGDLERAAR